MSNDMIKREKPTLRSALNFFSTKIPDVNSKRIQLNRSKGLAKYVTASQKNLRDITFLDTTFGVMSFSLYILRFSSNMGLLAHLLYQPAQKNHSKKLRNLYLNLLNDSLWFAVNMTQFFVLSFKNSTAAGMRGLQLEALAQLIDLIVILIRFKYEKDEYERKYNNATDIEKKRLSIEWQSKELNLFRTVITSLSMVIAFSLYSFSIVALPLSPIFSAIVLVSTLSKLLIDINNDRQLIQLLEFHNTSPQQIIKEKQEMTKARLQNLNQIILNNVFLPLGFFLLLTTPIPVAVIACVSMILIHYLINNLIEIIYSPDILEPQPLNSLATGGRL